MPFLLFSKKYFRAGAETDCGLKRTENQDAYRCLPARGLFIVSDGMGGGEGGRRAAEMVVRILEQAVAAPMKHLSGVTKFAYQANAEICNYAKEHNLRSMGATIVGILLNAFQPGAGMLFSAGDSRGYRLRNGVLTQLSTDHTIASAMGVGEETLAKHLQGILTNVAGGGAGFFLETRELALCAGDVYLLCSDGISRQVPKSEIKRILESAGSPAARARALIEASLKAGGVDNATAIVLEFDSIPEVTPDVAEEEAKCPDEPEEEGGDDATPPTE